MVVLVSLALAAACGGGSDGEVGEAPTTTVPRLDAVAVANALCGASPPEQTGAIQSPELSEISGFAVSRSHPDVLWTHNDSGGGPNLFAVGDDGSDRGRWVVPGASAEDWEAIAIAPGTSEEGDQLYIGDIGDNAKERPEITVHRFDEPVVTEGGLTVDEEVQGVETLRLVYPDAPQDAEVMLVDPTSGGVVVVTKPFPAGVAEVFRAEWPEPTPPEPVTLEQVGEIDFAALPTEVQVPASAPETPRLLGHLATDGSVTADGSVVAIRTYSTVWVWARPDDGELWQAFEGPPCEAPIALERQGEAIGLLPEGDGFFTASEGANQTVYETLAG